MRLQLVCDLSCQNLLTAVTEFEINPKYQSVLSSECLQLHLRNDCNPMESGQYHLHQCEGVSVQINGYAASLVVLHKPALPLGHGIEMTNRLEDLNRYILIDADVYLQKFYLKHPYFKHKLL